MTSDCLHSQLGVNPVAELPQCDHHCHSDCENLSELARLQDTCRDSPGEGASEGLLHRREVLPAETRSDAALSPNMQDSPNEEEAMEQGNPRECADIDSDPVPERTSKEKSTSELANLPSQVRSCSEYLYKNAIM